MEQETSVEQQKEARLRAEEARTWGMLCHLSVFAGFVIPLGNIFGPLTVWLMKRDSIPEVMEQGKEAMNFQISIMIYLIILVIALIATLIGAAAEQQAEPLIATFGSILGILALVVFENVCVIIATVHASRGATFRYPLSIRFIS